MKGEKRKQQTENPVNWQHRSLISLLKKGMEN
jgi:hypothetical protein